MRFIFSVLIAAYTAMAGAGPDIPSIGKIAKKLNPTHGGEVCNLEMENADVQSVIKGLALQHGKNVIFASEVKSKRTLTLKGITFDDALTQLLRYDNMLWKKDRDIYVVGTKEKLEELFPAPKIDVPAAPAPVIISDSYLCRYIRADNAVEVIGKLYADQKELVCVIAPGPVAPELSSSTSTSTGINAQPLSSGGQDRGSRRIFLRGPQELVGAAVTALRQMDMPRKQVNIAVSIRDVSNEALKELGLQWSWSTIGLREQPASGITFGKYKRNPFNIDSILSAIDSDTRTKLLASPNVSVLDGEKAFVLIGQRLNFPVLVGYSQANTPIFSKQEERVGIYLQVSALIADNGDIQLTLYPQVSSVTSFIQINGGSYPQISTREAQTTLRVHDGEPIVIGGLMRQEEISTLEKVPGLGDIPLFGELFRHRKKTKSSSQVIIVITPTILIDRTED